MLNKIFGPNENLGYKKTFTLNLKEYVKKCEFMLQIVKSNAAD